MPIKKMAVTLEKFIGQDNKLVLVAGGGENARAYITTARKLGADESSCDLIGIRITQANAELLSLAFEEHTAGTAFNLGELRTLAQREVIIMGGLQPGQSTNAVAALAAEITHADVFVNGTDVDGIYTEDPKKNPKAKLLKTIEIRKLLSLAMSGEVFAGKYELLDPIAVRVLQRSRMPTRFVSLEKPENIIQAINGRDIGTNVVYD